jgi:hypothetical protein
MGDHEAPTLIRTSWKTGSWRDGRREQDPGDAPSPRVWNVPNRSVVVAGHRQLLAAVQRTLQAGSRALLCPAQDRAGTGATTAMVEFARRHAHDYDIVWWVRATDPELVPDELSALAVTLGMACTHDDAETAAARALDTLRHRDRYLLVFDDAANPNQLARFLPTGPGDIVIISSDPAWRSCATAHTVEPFSRVESVALLCARRPDLPVDTAARIATALDDVPLAVDPAAALLADTRTDAEQFLRLLSGRIRRSRTPDPVLATWEVVFDHLAADDPAALALLTLAAWLGPEPVPLRILADHPHELPEILADAALNPAPLARPAASLRRRGTAQITSDAIVLHRIPAELLLRRTAGDRLGDGTDGWAAVAVRLLRAAVPTDPDAPALWARWRRLLPLVLAATDPARPLDTVTADAGWLLHRAAHYLRARGQLRAAETLSRDADDLCAAARVRQPSEDRPTSRVRPGHVMSALTMEA